METDKKLGLYSEFFAMDTEAMNLLGDFFEWLKSSEGAGLTPAVASPLAHDADRYLRDFLVEIMELRPSATSRALVLSYLGNWYPINTLEPSHAEIDRIAKALSCLHRYLSGKGVVAATVLKEIDRLLEAPDFFHERLDAFWALIPEQVDEWREVGEYRKTHRNNIAN